MLCKGGVNIYSEIVENKKFGGVNPVQFGYQKCEPSHSYGPAVRTHWLIHFVLSGCGIFEIDGKTYTVRAGSLFVIPPMIETYYEADSQNPWYYTWIGFDADDSVTLPFSRPVFDCFEAKEIFEQMRFCSEYEAGKSAYLAGCIWRLIALISEHGKHRPDYIDMALSCIHSEYTNNITVGEIAQRLSLDRSYFSTLFQKRMGVSPAKYLRNYRLSKAAELMTRYGEKPAVAANSVGYYDLFHFSKAFKQYYGVSPRKYIDDADIK